MENERLPIPFQGPGQLGEILDEAERYVIFPQEESVMAPASVLREALGRIYPYAPSTELYKAILPYLSEEKYRRWGFRNGLPEGNDRRLFDLSDAEIALEVRNVLGSLSDEHREDLLRRVRILDRTNPEWVQDYFEGRGSWREADF